jgi:hypothetical protein
MLGMGQGQALELERCLMIMIRTARQKSGREIEVRTG